MKKVVWSLMLSLMVITLSGCATSKGMVQDSKDIWQAILETDEWIKENMW